MEFYLSFYFRFLPFTLQNSSSSNNFPSALIVGIILGMLYANSLRNKLPETWVPGIKFVPNKSCAQA